VKKIHFAVYVDWDDFKWDFEVKGVDYLKDFKEDIQIEIKNFDFNTPLDVMSNKIINWIKKFIKIVINNLDAQKLN